MPVVSPSVDAFLVLAAAILLPAVYFFRHQSQPFTLHRALSRLFSRRTFRSMHNTLTPRFRYRQHSMSASKSHPRSTCHVKA